MTLQEHLVSIGACKEARDWAENRTAKQAWGECDRPNWLQWWARRIGGHSRVQFIRIACDCARLVLPPGDDRSRLALEAAERWADNPTEDNRVAAKEAGKWGGSWSNPPTASMAASTAALGAGIEDISWQGVVAANSVSYAIQAAPDISRKTWCDMVRNRLVIPWVE